MTRLLWLLRVRLPARWRLIRGSADELNRRAIVEQYLFDCAKGKRPLPDAERCRRMALKLGIPGNDIRIDPPEPEDQPPGANVVSLRR